MNYFFFQLSDQKQITCWRTKEKYTSPVIYDRHLKKYVAVFNYSYLKMWDENENVELSKKYKVIFYSQKHGCSQGKAGPPSPAYSLRT